MSIGSKGGMLPPCTILSGDENGDSVVGCLFFEYLVGIIRGEINFPILLGEEDIYLFGISMYFFL